MTDTLSKTQKIAVLLSAIDLKTVKDLSEFLSDDEMQQISKAVEDVSFLNGNLLQDTLEEFYTQLSRRGSYADLFSGSIV